MIHGLKDVFQEITLYLSKEENVDVKNFSAFLGSCQFCGLAHVLPRSSCIPRHRTYSRVASQGRAAMPSQLPRGPKAPEHPPSSDGTSLHPGKHWQENAGVIAGQTVGVA